MARSIVAALEQPEGVVELAVGDEARRGLAADREVRRLDARGRTREVAGGSPRERVAEERDVAAEAWVGRPDAHRDRVAQREVAWSRDLDRGRRVRGAAASVDREHGHDRDDSEYTESTKPSQRGAQWSPFHATHYG